jgi:hypothetical protein
MLSSGASFMSATGTYSPSIWQKELPNCSFAMSLRAGNSDQPERDTAVRTSRAAPQRGQLRSPLTIAPHQEHFI